MRRLSAILCVVLLILLVGCAREVTLTRPTITPNPPSTVGPETQSPPNCAWWSGLSQAQRNSAIVAEAIHSVGNHNVSCSPPLQPPTDWNTYLLGRGYCYIFGNWNYCCGTGVGGQCKPFVVTLLGRASGGAASLPGTVYDYRCWWPYRNKQDAINYAQPGEVLQFTGDALHTCIVITNFHDGRFEVVDSNFVGANLIGQHIIDTSRTGTVWHTADLKSYVISGCSGQQCQCSGPPC